MLIPMRDIRRANNPRTNQRTHTRACAHCNTAYNTYAHTTKQYKTRRYDTIRYETGRSSVSHSPSGSISQFLLPLFRVALIRRRCGFQNGDFAAGNYPPSVTSLVQYRFRTFAVRLGREAPRPDAARSRYCTTHSRS